MAGLTRFLFLMNFCEKIAIPPNVYRAFLHFEKDTVFRIVKKLFVLQGLGYACGP
jgi:hypothetical protein